MLKTLEDLLLKAHLISLLELCSIFLVLGVDVLHPAVMGLSMGICDMFLENNHVGVWNSFRVGR